MTEIKYANFDYAKFNFNNLINRDHLDMKVHNNKRAFVDAYNKQSKSDPSSFLRIWQDPATFAYQFLRIDGAAMSLYPYQDIILNDPHRFIYFRASNQIGKSISLDADAVFEFTHDHGFGFNCAIVSKTLPQATFQMRRVKELLNSANFSWKEVKGSTDNMTIISLDFKDADSRIKYSNLIICAPCTEGLLGYNLHKLYLDEFEFWEVDQKYFFEQIAEPRTYATKGRVMIFTNPNGSDNYGEELENVTLPDGTKKFHTYNFNYLDKPGNTQLDLDIAAAGKDRASVESTLLAIRSISDRNYFSHDEIAKSFDAELDELKMVGKQPFFFLDVGAKKDASVLVGGFIEPDEQHEKLNRLYIPIIHVYPTGYPLSRVVGSNIDPDDGWACEKSVTDYLTEWSADGANPTFGVDATGNTGIIPLFEAANIYPVDVQFSGPVKSGMYQRFKYFMEKGLLHRIKSTEFDYQCAHLQMKKSIRGYLMVHHESENDHDDVPDSVAGLIHLADNPDFVEPTLTML